MIPIPNHPEYFVDGTDIISMKFNKRRVMKQTVGSGGYKQVEIDGKMKTVHKLIAQAYLPNYSKDLVVDHMDWNKLNNDPSNLKMRTHAENCQNRDAEGCYLMPSGNWEARIKTNGKQKYLGTFPTKEEARAKYLAQKKADHPAFIPASH